MSEYSFRPVEESDLDFLADHRNDPEVNQNLTSVLPVLKDKQKNWLASLGGDNYYFIGLHNGSPIAFLRLNDIDWVNRNAAVGLDIFKEYRGLHRAKPMLGTLVRYCFMELNLHRLWLLVLATNEVAIKVYEGVGFQNEGIQREHIFRNGKYEDYLLMGLLRDEWHDSTV
jgi:RimJ/RimL family protein N-acetyltransferase